MPKIDRWKKPLKRLANMFSVYVMFLLLGVAVFFVIAEICRLTPQRFKKSNIEQLKDNPSETKANLNTDESLNLPFYQFPSRDMFSRADASTEFIGFCLEAIEMERIPIVYRGYINLDDDTYIAQINKEDKTYFLKEGLAFDDFKIQDISKEKVVLKNRNGESFILENAQPIYKKERVAILSDDNGKGKYRLFKGAFIKDYRVLQVGSDRILLVSRINNKKVLLRMER